MYDCSSISLRKEYNEIELSGREDDMIWEMGCFGLRLREELMRLLLLLLLLFERRTLMSDEVKISEEVLKRCLLLLLL